MSSNDQTESICAVVVTRNRISLLQECIDAIRSQTRPVSQILVVDNDSSDGTREWLADQPDIWSIFQENLGGAGGFHRGMKEAVQAGFEAVWVMDDDTIPEVLALEELQKVFATVPNASFVCSRVILPDGSAGNLPKLGSCSQRLVRATQYLDRSWWPVSAATFVSVLFKTTIVESIGYPIADMFIWGDDIEYTSRAATKGPAFVVGTSTVMHKTASVTGWSISRESNSDRLKLYHFKYQNDLFNTWVHGKPKDAALLACEVMRELSGCLRAPDFRVSRIRAIIQGLTGGLKMIKRYKYA
jgi:GT2 family glycosyltransferase